MSHDISTYTFLSLFPFTCNHLECQIQREVGTLALQIISLIQSIQACDFTMLVVDDNGSGKLIDWYESKGYQKAPKLQAMLGSPDGIHGISMMIPTNRVLPDDCKIQWW